MGKYVCQKCSNHIDTDRFIDDGKFYGEEQYRCPVCKTFLLKEALSSEDLAKANWASRNYESPKTYTAELIMVSVCIVIFIVVYSLF